MYIQALVPLFFLLAQQISSLPIFLENKSFSLTSSVSRLTSGDEVDGNLQSFRAVRESYSWRQRRAQIEYSSDDDSFSSGVFFLDAKEPETALIFEVDGATCKSSDSNELRSLLLLDTEPFEAIDTVVPPHIVGLARVLFFIETHRSGFELKGTRLVNNRPVSEYYLKYTCPSNDLTLAVVAYYNEPWRQDSQVPMRVSLVSGSTSILISYSDFSLINDFLSISEHKNSFLTDTAALLDWFAFPPLESCVNALYSRAYPIFEHKFRDKYEARLSFEARFITKSLEARVYGERAEFNTVVKVSYDGSLDALMYREQDKAGVFKQLLNLRRLRMFQALEKPDIKDSRCIITKIPKPVTGLTLGDILTGANFYVDLGKSRVRGIQCRVYAARIRSLPYWVEQPIKFRSIDDTSRIRPTDRGRGRAVLHVKEEDMSPVQLVIYQEKTMHIINFFNFIWSLDESIRPSEQFTLENVCSLSKEQRFKVDMSMVDDVSGLAKYSASDIELGFLQSLQDNLGLPINMVYQLKSKLQMATDTHGKFLTSFRVSAQSKYLVETVYVGQGYPNPNFAQRFNTIALRSFQLCLWVAATRGKDLYFGYNAPQRRCAVDVESSSFEGDIKKPPGFILDSVSAMEVYRVRESEDAALKLYWSNSNWMDLKSREKFKLDALRNRIVILGKPYLMDSVGIEPLAAISDESALDTGKAISYVGFGLKNERPNRLVDPSHLKASPSSEALATSSSLEQCHSACIADFKCLSFSVCARHFQTECILSPINLEGADMRPLLDSMRSTSVTPRTLEVQLADGSSVELVRHSNCVLYRKSLIELFNKMSKTTPRSKLVDRSFLSVDSLESCAKFCTDRNIEILSKEKNLMDEYTRLLSSDHTEARSHQKQIQSIRRQHKVNSNGFCFQFYYLEKEAAGEKRPELDGFERFCSIDWDRDKVQENATTLGPETRNIDVDVYEFKVNMFYEGQAGFCLRGYDLRTMEKETYLRVKEGRLLDNEESYKSLLKVIEEGHNLQEFTIDNELDCAKACFTQTYGPWPACRSFDIIRDSRSPLSVCRLNSVTLQQANKNSQNLIDSNMTRVRSATHYEPLMGYTLDQSLLVKELQLATKPTRYLDSWVVDLFVTCSILCLALVSSIAISCLAIKFMARQNLDNDLLRAEYVN